MGSDYRCGPFDIRPDERLVLRDGQAVALGARAFDVLLRLIEHRDRVVGKSELLDAVWAGLVVEESNIHVQVSALRKELGAGLIATIPGRGYRFVGRLQGDAEASAAAPVAASGGHNLPPELDPLIGRDDEVMQLRAAVLQHRLVSVLGPGGIGKTRVARAACRDLHPHFAQGLWWVDLAAVSGATQLAVAVAHAARVQLGGDLAEGPEQLLLGLASRATLLVLDNCEHLAAEVADLVLALQARAPGVCVLATSQEALKVPGGHDFRLGPLTLAETGDSLQRARESAALRLLEVRAQAVDQRFRLDDDNLAAAIELVRRLDGNPLAIEMAAARVPLLGLSMLNQRLDERFRILRGSARAADARHQTLQAMLAWSDSLLDEEERALLQRLAVFVGSFRVDLAQAVRPDDAADPWSALDTLSTLVDKSLVQLETLEPPRYRLLETVRLFYLQQLQQQGRLSAALARHGQALAALGDEAEAAFWQTPESAWLARHAPDYDDLQAAFDRACARGDADCAARTGAALLRLDHLRNVHTSRRQRAEALHALLPHAGALAQALIWSGIASHGLIAMEGVSRADAARHAVDAWRALGDPMRLHFALGFLAAERAREHDFDSAEALLAECRLLERPDWPPRRLMWGASAASGVQIHRGDGPGYRAATRRELELAERAGAERAAAWARLKLADAALMAGDCDEAIALGEAAVQALRQLDQPSNLGLALSNLCAARLLGGRPSAAAAALEALPLMWRSGWGYLLADGIALLAAQAGQAEAAGQLLGHADAWYAHHGDTRQPNEAALARRAAARIEADLGAEPAAAWRARGGQLDDAAARALALKALAAPGVRARP